MHNPVSNSTRISTTGLLGLKMHVSFQLVGQFKIIFPHFTGLQQGWVGGPWTEYFQNCDTDFISFIKRVSWGFRFQDTCVVKVEKLSLMFGRGGRELFRLGNPLIISVPPTWMGLSSSSTLDSN